MKLLLDTHIWLWSLIDPGQLSKRVADELVDPSNELWVSPISTWEILLLSEKG
jgi:PIN domain nuclease of toxin-antitoxin system